MANQEEGAVFLLSLKRIRSANLLPQRDKEFIRDFPVNIRSRLEEQISLDRGNEATARKEFMLKGFGGNPVPSFHTFDAGLRASGWAEIPRGGLHIGQGAYGHLRLAYKLSDEPDVQLEFRHLCAMKIQPPKKEYEVPEEYQVIWNEVEILRGLVHENVVDYFTHFAVDDGKHLEICILLEYGSAGDLDIELKRYPKKIIEEAGARYYALQICQGVEYMHSRFVVHQDLHSGNVILKYNPDGSKTCMICDFGQSKAFKPSQVGRKNQFGVIVVMPTKRDVLRVCSLAKLMMRGQELLNQPILTARYSSKRKLTQEAIDLISIMDPSGPEPPETISDLMAKYVWFNQKSLAPFPSPPAPVLKRKVIRAMGYQPASHPPPGWSREEKRDRSRSRESEDSFAERMRWLTAKKGYHTMQDSEVGQSRTRAGTYRPSFSDPPAAHEVESESPHPDLRTSHHPTAHAATESGVQEASDLRQRPVGIRQSLTSIGQSVFRRLNCFNRRHNQDAG